MVNALRINPQDNVVVALMDLPPDTALNANGLDLRGLATREAIPFGHKVAVAPIAIGEVVVKYGASIGLATQDIAPGQHVHTHNLRSVRGAVRP